MLSQVFHIFCHYINNYCAALCCAVMLINRYFSRLHPVDSFETQRQNTIFGFVAHSVLTTAIYCLLFLKLQLMLIDKS